MTSPLTGLRILISGAGVTGPALAYWLSRSGAETTVVEIAPTLRASGFAVDFRGPTHLGVLERMGLIDDLRAIQTHSGALRCVDELGRTIFELPAEIAGGDIEVNRRDLSRALYELSAPMPSTSSARRSQLFPNWATAYTSSSSTGKHVPSTW